jgi:hypothetical protein
MSFLCWGRLLFLRGIWWDDWAWVWHYFCSADLSEFIVPFNSLRHPIDGIFFFWNFKLFEVMPGFATNVWSIWKFILYVLNPLLLYFIIKDLTDDRSVLPGIIAITYLVSPVVNNLCTVELIRRAHLFFFLFSMLLSMRSVGKNGIKMPYYLSSVFFSAFSIYGIESLFFFELARPAVISCLFYKRQGMRGIENLKSSLFFWAPFFLIGLSVLFYTIGFLNPRSGIYAHAYDPSKLPVAEYVIVVIKRYIVSLLHLFTSYIYLFINQDVLIKQTYIFMKQNIPLKNYIVIAGTAFFAALFAVLTISGSAKKDDRKNPGSSREAAFAAAFGMILTLIGLFPYMVVRGPIYFGLETRHALLASVGFSIFLPSAAFWIFIRSRINRVIYYLFFGAIVFFGVFTCNAAVKAYHDDWQEQRSFWSQFVKKAPGIRDGTFLVVDMERHEKAFFRYWRCYVETSGPLNLLYATSRDKTEMDKHYAETFQNATDVGCAYSYANNKNKDEVEFEDFKGTQKFYPKKLIAAAYIDGRLYLNNEIVSAGIGSGIRELAMNASPDQIIYKSRPLPHPLRSVMNIDSQPNNSLTK